MQVWLKVYEAEAELLVVSSRDEAVVNDQPPEISALPACRQAQAHALSAAAA